MSKYPTTNIVYSGIEDKGLTVTILDEKKNKWTIWKKDYENKDQDSEAWGSLQNFKIGESFGIEYGEKPESFVNKEGKTIDFTRRTIYKILPLVTSPSPLPPNSSAQGKSFNGEANRGQSERSGNAFGRRLGVQGHINALLSNPNYYGRDTDVKIANLVQEAIAIEDEAEKQLNPSPLRQAVQRHAPSVVDEELPTIQVEEEINLNDIPF